MKISIFFKENSISDDFRNCLQVIAAVTLIVLLSAVIAVVRGANTALTTSPFFTSPIYGSVKNNIRPAIMVNQKDAWDTCIYFTSTVPISNEWWLNVTNRIGCKVYMSETNGVILHSTNAELNAAFHLSGHAMMSNVLDYVFHARGGPKLLDWIYLAPDSDTQVYRFQLSKLFLMRLDREYVLQISPMLYKAEANPLTVKSIGDVITNPTPADLVEFAPIILRLQTNGGVALLDALPWVKGP